MSTGTKGKLDPTRFALQVQPYDHPHAQHLVRGLFDEQVERYGYADPHEADPALYTAPDGLFLVGYLAGEPVSCGGYRTHDRENHTVEIKKMYTLPPLRGHGLGAAILAELELRAALSGAKRSILETGVRNTAALALYRSLGYRPTDRYVAGRDPAINRAFIKELGG